MYIAVVRRVEERQEMLSPVRGHRQVSEAPPELRPEQFCPSTTPPGVRPRMFCPSTDLSAAAFLLEADSLKTAQDYIESTVGRSSENSYFEINAEYARGLPESTIAG